MYFDFTIFIKSLPPQRGTNRFLKFKDTFLLFLVYILHMLIISLSCFGVRCKIQPQFPCGSDRPPPSLNDSSSSLHGPAACHGVSGAQVPRLFLGSSMLLPWLCTDGKQRNSCGSAPHPPHCPVLCHFSTFPRCPGLWLHPGLHPIPLHPASSHL